MPVGSAPHDAALRRISVRTLALVSLVCAVSAAGCGRGLLEPQYEYEEELYLDLDGSARLNLNASVAALVALHGVDLPVDPEARLDRERVRALFERPGADVSLSLSRRDGRRFVHVSVDVDDLEQLSSIRPFSWSTYRMARRDEAVEYRQTIGPARGEVPPNVGWTGQELIAFRIHVPSEIFFHNSGGNIRRGNILEWEQPLAKRLAGEPLDLVVHMAPESILYTTLLLFGATILAAAAAFGVALWWIARRGRGADLAESHP